MFDGYVMIGILRKTFGVDGWIRFEIDENYEDDVLESEHLFVNVAGKLIPYFIEEFKESSGILVKFEEVDDKEVANSLANLQVYLSVDQVSYEKDEEELSFEKIKGFQVFDKGVKVGPIAELIQMPEQTLAIVMINKRSMYIPIVEEFIIGVNFKKREIQMDLPEGLLDL